LQIYIGDDAAKMKRNFFLLFIGGWLLPQPAALDETMILQTRPQNGV
jgi:hypothetical protein